MASLSQADTRELDIAQTQVSAVMQHLRSDKPITDQDRRNMAELLKQAGDKIKTVKIMKGEYPK